MEVEKKGFAALPGIGLSTLPINVTVQEPTVIMQVPGTPVPQGLQGSNFLNNSTN